MSNIDQQFSDQLGNYRSPLSDRLWENLDQKLDQRTAEDKPIFPTWGWFALLGGVLLMGFGYIYTAENSTTAYMTPVAETNVANQPEAPKSAAAAAFAKAENETSTATEIKTPEPAEQRSSPTTDRTNTGKSTPPPSVPKKPDVVTGFVAPITPSAVDYTTVETVNSEAMDAEQTAHTTSAFLSENALQPSTKTPFSAAELLQIELQPLASMPAQFQLPDGCYSFGARGPIDFSWALEVYGGPEFAQRTLQARTTEAIRYQEVRDSLETSNIGFTGGIRAALISDNGMVFKAGLAVTQINEKFEYTNEREQRMIITTNTDPDGNVISIDTTLETGIRNKETYNIHRHIDLPITAGIQFGDDRLKIGINGGLGLNITTYRKGDIVDPTLFEPVTFTEGQVDGFPVFETRVGMSVIASAALIYNLTSNMDLMLEPSLRYYFNGQTRNTYPVKQTYVTPGVHLGIRYHLGSNW